MSKITKQNIGEVLDELVRRGVVEYGPRKNGETTYRGVGDAETLFEELERIENLLDEGVIG